MKSQITITAIISHPDDANPEEVKELVIESLERGLAEGRAQFGFGEIIAERVAGCVVASPVTETTGDPTGLLSE